MFMEMGCELCMCDYGAIDQFNVAEESFRAALCQANAFLYMRILFADLPRFVALHDEVQTFFVHDDGSERKGIFVVDAGFCMGGE